MRRRVTSRNTFGARKQIQVDRTNSPLARGSIKQRALCSELLFWFCRRRATINKIKPAKGSAEWRVVLVTGPKKAQLLRLSVAARPIYGDAVLEDRSCLNPCPHGGHSVPG